MHGLPDPTARSLSYEGDEENSSMSPGGAQTRSVQGEDAEPILPLVEMDAASVSAWSLPSCRQRCSAHHSLAKKSNNKCNSPQAVKLLQD